MPYYRKQATNNKQSLKMFTGADRWGDDGKDFKNETATKVHISHDDKNADTLYTKQTQNWKQMNMTIRFATIDEKK